MTSLTKRQLLSAAALVGVGGSAFRAAAQDMPAHERPQCQAM